MVRGGIVSLWLVILLIVVGIGIVLIGVSAYLGIKVGKTLSDIEMETVKTVQETEGVVE